MTYSLYKNHKWIRKRTIILKRDEYLCRECKRYGRSMAAATVHHIYPLKQYPELALVNENLLSLCSKCHDAMHDRVSNELTALGMEWVDRVSPLLAAIKI